MTNMERKWLFRILIIFFCAVFLVSGFLLVRYYVASFKQKAQMNALAEMVEHPEENTVPPEATVPQADLDPQITVNGDDGTYLHVKDPVTGEAIRLLRKYAALYLENTDTVGWIRIEGTSINYPVMQTPNEPNYYLRRGFDREYANHGCIYVREECNVFAPSDNLTIYGHRMGDGTMFNDLQNYKKESYFIEHPVITFDTIFEAHDYQILSVFLTTATVGEGFTYHDFIDAKDEAQFDQYVATCKSLSLYDTGVDAQYGDKLITLSTCEYSQTNGRLVVVAKRITEE